MHKSISFLALLVLITGQFIACKKDNSNPSSLPVTSSDIAGDFTVNSFITSSDQTATFNGYRFTFSENGTITATQGNTVSTGTWQFDDSDNSELKLNFSNSPLNELNKGWHIAELTTEHMLLTDDDDSHESGDDNPSGHSKLEFERD